MVMGGDSCPEGHGLRSQHCILDGHFSHIIVAKIVMFFRFARLFLDPSACPLPRVGLINIRMKRIMKSSYLF